MYKFYILCENSILIENAKVSSSVEDKEWLMSKKHIILRMYDQEEWT